MPYMICTCIDLRDHYLVYLRDHLLGLILFFWLILLICPIPCLVLTSFAFISFSQRCLSRVLILFEDVSFVSSLSRFHVFQWFPTGLSFCFTFPALPSSSIYLLLTKHACYARPSIFILHLYLSILSICCIPRVFMFIDNFLPQISLYNIASFSFSFLRHLMIIRLFFNALAFFLSKVTLSFNLVAS